MVEIFLKPLIIEAKTISEAWFQIMYYMINNEHYYIQRIQQGSFANTEIFRLQIPSLTVFIEEPWRDIIPEIPIHYNIPNPVSEEYLQDYFVNYLLDDTLQENETYKYASRILYRLKDNQTQLEKVIKLLKETPFTNQAIIEIGAPFDWDICYDKYGNYEPPCLRLLDFKVIPINGKKVLTLSVYFRSNDLWAGFPVNLGGLELLKQYICEETGLENGSIYYYSSGAHIYSYQLEFVKIRLNKKDLNIKI